MKIIFSKTYRWTIFALGGLILGLTIGGGVVAIAETLAEHLAVASAGGDGWPMVSVLQALGFPIWAMVVFIFGRQIVDVVRSAKDELGNLNTRLSVLQSETHVRLTHLERTVARIDACVERRRIVFDENYTCSDRGETGGSDMAQ